MFYDDAIKEYGDINFKINKKYCEKYNIDLILSNFIKYKNRSPTWERLPLILQYINAYDYLIWIDADAFFYKDATNIIEIIQQNIDIPFIFSNDIGDKNINAGFFIVKNNEYSIGFLKKWAFDKDLYLNNPKPHWQDQSVLISMMDQNVLDINNNHISYPYGVLQHFGYANENFLKNDLKPFILHFAGRSFQKRVEVSNVYYNKYFYSYSIKK